MSYQAEYQRSLEDPETFWAEQAQALPWKTLPRQIVSQDGNGVPRWFADGELNTSWLCLDRHVEEGRGDQIAVIYDSPVTQTVKRYTFKEMRDWVAKVAGALVGLGVGQGDRVVIYMPMVPEAAVAMLACARIGAVHSVVFGGFASPELATRLDDCTPKVILAASCGLEFANVIEYKPLVDKAVELAVHKPDHVVVLQREQARAALDTAGRDIDWESWVEAAAPAAAVVLKATDPLYILYTSGTTGKPKGVLRDNGGHAVALHYSMGAVYDIDIGDVFWAASDVGWVVGHSYIVYAPLLKGCTTVLFEGKPVRTPDAGVYWRVIQEHKVKSFFVAPTAFRAIKKEDPNCELKAQYDISSLKYQFVAGERLDTDTIQWAEEKLKVPVIDHWWQTETGWPQAANPLGLGLVPTKHGSAAMPMPGFDIQVLDDNAQPVPEGETGALVIKLPLPPGCLQSLWQDDQRFIDSYLSEFTGYYATADAGFIDADGYVHVMSRLDDVINVAGHRLSTGAMEEVLAGHPDVAECAVIGVTDALKGQLPLGFSCTNSGTERSNDDIVKDCVSLMREKIGPVAAFKHAVVVQRLPKTRSGKILRATMVKIADGEDFKMPATIDDPAILDEIKEALKAIGYAS